MCRKFYWESSEKVSQVPSAAGDFTAISREPGRGQTENPVMLLIAKGFQTRPAFKERQ